MRVLLGQLSPSLGKPLMNLKKIAEVLQENGPVDVAIFPELFLSGYYLKDMFLKVAVKVDEGEELEELKRIAKSERTVIVVGFPERSPRGYLYNSLIAVNQAGTIHIYRKRHLPTFSIFDENRWFKPYHGSINPWPINGVLAGFAICYDVFFPEIFRSYALGGASIMIAISASPDSSVDLFEILCKARALENTSYFIWVNQVGNYNGIGFGGGSMVVSPMGEIIKRCKKMEEDPVVVEIDLEEVNKSRFMRPVLRDARREDAEQLLETYLTQGE